jgi:tetratricopeptide (TPR) repeat protein
MSCAACNAPDAKNECSGCHTVRYCGKVCQASHWPAHKAACKNARAAPARAPPPPRAPFVIDLHCGSCGMELTLETGNKCGSCARIAYCGKACQKAHWPEHKAACFEATAARVFAGEGELHLGAEKGLKRAMEKAREELGAEHAETLRCMHTYAEFLRKVGRYEEAGALSREVLAVFRRTLGDEHPNTLVSINNLALLLADQGMLGEAEPLYREALSAQRRTLGDEHPDTLMSINNLANLLLSQGKLGEAEPLHRVVLSARRRALGDEHPSTLSSINNLALLLKDQGKLGEAEPLCREALSASRRTLGDEHPSTLTSIFNFAGLLLKQGKRAEALGMYRPLLEACRRVWGEGHPRTQELSRLLSRI